MGGKRSVLINYKSPGGACFRPLAIQEASINAGLQSRSNTTSQVCWGWQSRRGGLKSWLLSREYRAVSGDSDKLYSSGIERHFPILAMVVSKFYIFVIMIDFHLKEHHWPIAGISNV